VLAWPACELPRFLRKVLVANLFQDRYLAIDDGQHLEDVGNEAIAFAEQEHVESGGEVACDTREDTDLTSPRATIDHRPLGNPWMPILSTKKLSTYPRKSTERYGNKNGLLGVRRSFCPGAPLSDGEAMLWLVHVSN
jgi:hypothetical protein